MKPRISFLLISALILLGFHYYVRTFRNYYELSTSLYAMNGIEIEVKGYHTDQKSFKLAVAEMGKRFAALEDNLSRFKEGSEVSRINKTVADSPVKVSQSTFDIIQASIEISNLSKGAFDISCLPLIQLWKSAGKIGRLPGAKEIEEAKAKGSFRNIILDPKNLTVSVNPGMGIDLGGIAQGLFADEGAAILVRYGIMRGLVNCSGEITVYDKRPTPSPFSIGIFNPKSGKNDKIITLINGAVSTSGNYSRFSEILKKKYSHIIDPVSGYPSNDTASITIQGPNALEADAWSTACAVLGARGEDFRQYLPKSFKVLAYVKETNQQ